MNPFSRRELLAAFLGVTVASGCNRRTPLPPGELIGANVDLGHRLRQPPPAAPEKWEEVPVVIIGAGIAGLSAGWEFLRAGFDRFVLLELESAPGGTSRSSTNGIVPHPWGAHYLPAPMADNRDLLTLLREMSVIEGTDKDGEPIYAEHVLCRDPHERLYAHGHWYDGLYFAAGANDDDRAQQQRFHHEIDRWVAFRDGKGRKAFTLPMARGSDDPVVTALDQLSMTEWLDQRQFSSKRLRWLIDYGCRDDYGSSPDDTSAWAALFYFASRRRTPGAEPQPLLTWPEGNGRLASHLAQRAKGHLRLDLAVADITPSMIEGKQTLEILALSTDGVVGIRANHVIFAAPHFLTRYVLRPYRDHPPAELSTFEYGSWMVANLHLKSRPSEPDVPLAWDNVLYDSPSLGYVVATHQACLDHGPTIFTYYYPLIASNSNAARAQLLQLGRDEWAELALADLERAHPDIRRLVTRIDVIRWGHAMIRPKPGFVWSRARRDAAQPYRGIHFAHSDLSGLALFEEAFYHGVRAAREILAVRGVPRRNS
jgi:protoporphyrinogen oxidase